MVFSPILVVLFRAFPKPQAQCGDSVGLKAGKFPWKVAGDLFQRLQRLPQQGFVLRVLSVQPAQLGCGFVAQAPDGVKTAAELVVLDNQHGVSRDVLQQINQGCLFCFHAFNSLAAS